MLLKTKDLVDRWQVTTRTIANIPTNRLPKVNISSGSKRPTWRYRLEDVRKYEEKGLMGEQ